MSDFDPESTNLVFLGENKTPIASVRYKYEGFIISNYILSRIIMAINMKMPDFKLNDNLDETQDIDYFKNSSNQDIAEIIKESVDSMSDDSMSDEGADTVIFADSMSKICELMADSEKNVFIDLSEKIINLSPLVLDDRLDRFSATLNGLNEYKADDQDPIDILSLPLIKTNWKIDKLTINQFYELSGNIMQNQLYWAQNNESMPAFVVLTDSEDLNKSTRNWVFVA